MSKSVALLLFMEGISMEAGNTVETLRAVDVSEAAPAPVLAVEAEDTPTPISVPGTDEDEAVSREEFEELRDSFIRLVARVNHYNVGASHKI